MKSNPTLRSFLNRKHTRKEVFDFVRKKINEQGNPSIRVTSCVYRGENGSKCAVGHLVTDKDMAKVFPVANGLNVFNLADKLNIPNFDSLNEKKLHFLAKLQRVHDTASFDPIVGRNRKGSDFLDAYNKLMDKLAEELNLKD